MKKLKNKKFKGMTLVEIIISLAVVSALTLVLVGTSNIINNYLRSSTRVNKRVAQQAPVAEAANAAAAEDKNDGRIEIRITPEKGKGDVILSGDLYKMDNGGKSGGKEFGSELNMKFVSNIETTTIEPEDPGLTPDIP